MKDETKSTFDQFPWFKKDYQNVYDDLAYDAKKTSGQSHIYPKADITDSKIVMKDQDTEEKGLDDAGQNFQFPARFLVVTASSGGADNLIQIFEK